jgi:hypothetical protein
MASFCSSCGAPVTGRFCTACGATIQQTAAQVQNAVPSANPIQPGVPGGVAAAGTSSGAKILFIVLGGLMLLGAIGIGGIVYVGYRAKQKLTQIKQDYGIETAGSRASTSMRTFPPAQGNGCRLLEGQEAAGILGVAVERVESEPHGPSGGEMCRYWVSASERRKLVGGEIASGFKNLGDPNTKSGQADLEKLIGGAAGLMNEADGDNKNTDYAFSLQVWNKNGKEQWDKIAEVQSKTDAVAPVAMESVQGIGDRATEIAAGHSIMVLKGDTFFLIGFQQFVPGLDKTAALARVVAGRL